MWIYFTFHMINDKCHKCNLYWKHRWHWVCLHVPTGWCVYWSDFISFLLLFDPFCIHVCLLITVERAQRRRDHWLLHVVYPADRDKTVCCRCSFDCRSVRMEHVLKMYMYFMKMSYLTDLMVHGRIWGCINECLPPWSSPRPLPWLHESEWSMEEPRLSH